MSDQGFNSNIRVGKKKLHIQTSYAEETSKASVSVFEEGRLIDKREMQVDTAVAENVSEEVKQFHELVISDLKMLFYVAKQVRSSKYVPSIKKLGQLFLAKGFFDEAIDLFQLANKIDPRTADCSFELGQAYFKKSEFKTALEQLQLKAEANPEYPDVHLLIGQAFWKLAQFSSAIKSVKTAIRLNKEYDLAYFYLGKFLIESTIHSPKNSELAPPIERIKEAVKNFKMAMSLSTDFNPTAMASGFEKLESREKVEEALAEFDRAFSPITTPEKNMIVDSEFYLKFMFSGLEKDRELDHHIKTIEKSVFQHPDYPDLHQSLGLAYLIKGWHYFVKSTEEFRAAVKINPSFASARKKLKLLENDGRGFLILLRAILK